MPRGQKEKRKKEISSFGSTVCCFLGFFFFPLHVHIIFFSRICCFESCLSSLNVLQTFFQGMKNSEREYRSVKNRDPEAILPEFTSVQNASFTLGKNASVCHQHDWEDNTSSYLRRLSQGLDELIHVKHVGWLLAWSGEKKWHKCHLLLCIFVMVPEYSIICLIMYESRSYC